MEQLVDEILPGFIIEVDKLKANVYSVSVFNEDKKINYFSGRIIAKTKDHLLYKIVEKIIGYKDEQQEKLINIVNTQYEKNRSDKSSQERIKKLQQEIDVLEKESDRLWKITDRLQRKLDKLEERVLSRLTHDGRYPNHHLDNVKPAVWEELKGMGFLRTKTPKPELEKILDGIANKFVKRARTTPEYKAISSELSKQEKLEESTMKEIDKKADIIKKIEDSYEEGVEKEDKQLSALRDEIDHLYKIKKSLERRIWLNRDTKNRKHKNVKYSATDTDITKLYKKFLR